MHQKPLQSNLRLQPTYKQWVTHTELSTSLWIWHVKLAFTVSSEAMEVPRDESPRSACETHSIRLSETAPEAYFCVEHLERRRHNLCTLMVTVAGVRCKHGQPQPLKVHMCEPFKQAIGNRAHPCAQLPRPGTTYHQLGVKWPLPSTPKPRTAADLYTTWRPPEGFTLCVPSCLLRQGRMHYR